MAKAKIGAERGPDPTLLATRIEAALPAGFATTKSMFGGVTFLRNGNMLVCASRKGLMVRVGAEGEVAALAQPHATPCMGAGRPMTGFILVAPEGIATGAALARWIGRACSFVETLEPKSEKPKRKR